MYIIEYLCLGFTLFFVTALTVGLRTEARKGFIEQASINSRLCVYLLIAVVTLESLKWSFLNLIWVLPVAWSLAHARATQGISIPVFSAVVDWLVHVYLALVWVGIKIPTWSYLYASMHWHYLFMFGLLGGLHKRLGKPFSIQDPITSVAVKALGISHDEASILVTKWFQEYPEYFLGDQFRRVARAVGVAPEKLDEAKTTTYNLAQKEESRPMFQRAYGLGKIVEAKLGADSAIEYWVATIRKIIKAGK